MKLKASFEKAKNDKTSAYLSALHSARSAGSVEELHAKVAELREQIEGLDAEIAAEGSRVRENSQNLRLAVS